MDNRVEAENRYMVVAYTLVGAHIGFQSFTGDTAEAQAREHFETLKLRADAHEVWASRFTRMKWEVVLGAERNAAGGWETIERA
jgi:hypothetical protein